MREPFQELAIRARVFLALGEILMYATTIFAPVGAFLIVLFGTYVLFKSLGLRSTNLLFSRDDVAAFRKKLGGLGGGLLVVANIFGSLTSLATVYVFFIGTAKVFGWFILASPISIALSFASTNWFTRRALANNPEYNELLSKAGTASGVVARLVWAPRSDAKVTSWLVKHVSLLNIIAILWLEFSVAADLFAMAAHLPVDQVLVGSLATFVVAFSVIFLITRFGLRGYVFADFFQSPLVVLGTLAVLIALVIFAIQNLHVFQSASFGAVVHKAFEPKIPLWQGALFTVHVLMSNFFFVLVTESHWLRVWIFKDQETRRQLPGTIWAGLVWLLLGFAGLTAGFITQANGTAGVVPIIGTLSLMQPGLVLLFWLGGIAALFSVSDAQIYNYLMVSRFTVSNGALPTTIHRPRSAFLTALVAALVFSGVYALVRGHALPFEKIVFILLPMSLNALPAFLAVATRRKVHAIWTVISICLYIGASAVGLEPSKELAWSLYAALMPIAVSIVMFLLQRPEPQARGK